MIIPICPTCGKDKELKNLLIEGGGTADFWFCVNTKCPKGPTLIISLDLAEGPKLLWCNTHNRKTDNLKFCRGDGILLPCSIVDLTGIAEIEE